MNATYRVNYQERLWLDARGHESKTRARLALMDISGALFRNSLCGGNNSALSEPLVKAAFDLTVALATIQEQF